MTQTSQSAIIAVVVLIAVSAAAFYTLNQSAAGVTQQTREYTIDYDGIVAEKTVVLGAGEHKETLSLKADAELLGFVVYSVVPKELTESAGDIIYATNARIEVLEADPLIRISPKNSPNSIAVEMSFPNAGATDICTVNAVLPQAFVNSLTEEQQGQLNQQLLALALDLNCDSANALENTLAQNLVDAFSSGG